jgi:hypothetical protein
VLEKLFLDWEEFVLVNIDENARYDDENYHRNVFKRSLTFFEKNKDICNIYPCIAPGFNEFFEPYIEKIESKILRNVTNLLNKGVEAGFYRNDFDINLMPIFLSALICG